MLGVAFVVQAARLQRGTGSESAIDPQTAIRFFTFSNSYLALLFAAIAIDTLVRAA